MLIGILTLAMTFGSIAAAAAVISGQSVLTALALYIGCGVLCALVIILNATVVSVLQNRRTDLLQTGTTA